MMIGAVDTTGTSWTEVDEVTAQKLVEKHGGEQGDSMLAVETADSDLPLPHVDLATSAQVFQAPDGFRIFLATDEAELEYYFVKRGSQHVGLKPWQYAVAGVVGAGTGYVVLNRGLKMMKCPWAAVVGAAATMMTAGVVEAVIRRRPYDPTA